MTGGRLPDTTVEKQNSSAKREAV